MFVCPCKTTNELNLKGTIFKSIQVFIRLEVQSDLSAVAVVANISLQILIMLRLNNS